MTVLCKSLVQESSGPWRSSRFLIELMDKSKTHIGGQKITYMPVLWGHWDRSESLTALLSSSVDGGYLVQAIFFGLQSQVGDTVGHIHALGCVVVSARWRISCHCAVRKNSGCQDESSHFFLLKL